MRVKANYNNKSYVLNYQGTQGNGNDGDDVLGGFIKAMVVAIPELQDKINYNMMEIQFKRPFKKIGILENLDTPIKELGFLNGCQFWITEISDEKSDGGLINGDLDKVDTNKDEVAGNGDSNISTLSDTNARKSSEIEESNKGNSDGRSSNGNKKKKLTEPNDQIDKFYTYSSVSQGYFKLRKMADDNSCLFHSVSFCIFGDANHETELRNLVSTRILQDPERFNEAYLGKKVSEYVDWIKKPNSWGGAIEIQIFSEYYETEIHSIDIKSGRVDKFGEFDKFLVIFYSGVHFDAMSFKVDDSGKELGLFRDEDFDKQDVLQNAQLIREQLKGERYYTDMSDATFICTACNRFIKGEKEMVLHMKTDGHVDFEEVV